MKHHILSIGILLTLCLSFLPNTASAAATWESDVVGGSLSATLDDEGTLTISGTGTMNDWDSYSNPAPWYDGNTLIHTTIKKVVVSGATNIGKYAFAYCSNLTEVIIGNSVTKIGNYAFDSCYHLSYVVIPASVTTFETSSLGSLKYHPFYGCDELTIYGTSGSTAQTFASTYSIPFQRISSTPVLSVSSLTFDSVQEGYADAPAAQGVTVVATGKLTLSTSENFDLTLSTTELGSGDAATLNVRPKAGLAAGTYNETITINGASLSVSFTVTAPPAPVHTHTYNDDQWNSDTNNHWKECTDSNCPDKDGSIKDSAPHSPEGTEWKCSVCGYSVDPTNTEIPTAATGLVYNGTEQTGVAAGTGYTLSGDYKATNAGSYTATATLVDGYRWSNSTADPVTISWSIAKADGEASVTLEDWNAGETASVPVPTSSTNGIQNVTYAYKLKGADDSTYANFDTPPAEEGTYTLRATFAATTNYNEVVAYTDFTVKHSHVYGDYVWSSNQHWKECTTPNCPDKDGSIQNLAPHSPEGTEWKCSVCGYSVDPTNTEIPSAASGLVYNGNEQTGVAEGTGYILSGDYKATDAGSYTATATLVDGYQWSDGTSSPVTISWSIAKADGEASVTLEDWNAGETASVPVPTSSTNGIQNVTYAYKTKDADDSTYVSFDTPPTEKGSYTLRATFSATTNYNEVVVYTNFTVNHGHVYDDVWHFDASGHWHVCECGATSEVLAHIESITGKDCIICDYGKDSGETPDDEPPEQDDIPDEKPPTEDEHTHSFDDVWHFDASGHWHVCECGATSEVLAHIESVTGKDCVLCDYVKNTGDTPEQDDNTGEEPPTEDEHTHSFDDVWHFDASGHWHVCECGATSEVLAHIESVTGKDCVLCDYVKNTGDTPEQDDNTGEEPPAEDEHTHSFDDVWHFDASGHWHVCACGATSEVLDHIESITGKDCIICDYDDGLSDTVIPDPIIPPSSSDPTPSAPSTSESGGWTEIEQELSDTMNAIQSGKTSADSVVTIEMNGATQVPTEVLEIIAGQDITVEFDVGDGISWSVNGKDVPDNLEGLNLAVSTGGNSIPPDILITVPGSNTAVQLDIEHDGSFGTTLNLSVDLGSENQGYWANLYYFDKSQNKLLLYYSCLIGSDGKASWPFDHASSYAIILDRKNHDQNWENPFPDVSENNWFYEAVRFANRQGIMGGYPDGSFRPNTEVTRAEFIVTLWRLAGQPAVNYLMTFKDVNQDAWYAEAVRWAASEKLIFGYDGMFMPGDSITREQTAVMLYRYVQSNGGGFTGLWMFLLNFDDRADVSEWAYESMCWMTMNGIIKGSNRMLNPGGQTTRAEIAAILQRYYELNP